MKPSLPLLFFLLLQMLLPSCVRDVVMDAKEKPQVVVTCILTEDPEQTLQLFYTKGASQPEVVPVTEAKVTLLEREREWEEFHEVGHFKRSEGREWTLAYTAIPKWQYRLEIEVPGYVPISAEQTMPGVAKVIALSNFEYIKYYYYKGLHFPSWIPEAPPFVPNAEDFDELPLGTKSYYVLDLPDPVWICAMNYDPETGKHHIVEEICTECSLVDDFNTTGEKYVAPERTDIPNPYVDGSHVSKLAPQLEGRPLHKRYLRFPVKDLSEEKGWWFTLAGSMQGKYNCKDFYQYYYGDNGLARPLFPDEGYIEVSAVSKDFDDYLMDAHERQQIQQSSDLTTIYLRDNSYTNIVGGLGVFGARTVRRYQWSGEYDYVDDGVVHHYRNGPAVSSSADMYIPEDAWPSWGIE